MLEETKNVLSLVGALVEGLDKKEDVELFNKVERALASARHELMKVEFFVTRVLDLSDFQQRHQKEVH